MASSHEKDLYIVGPLCGSMMQSFDGSLWLAWTSCWTYSEVADDFRRHDTQVISLQWFTSFDHAWEAMSFVFTDTDCSLF